MVDYLHRHLATFHKRRVLKKYVEQCGALLQERYGRQEAYSAPQVSTALDKSDAGREFFDYALAMFMTRADFVEAIQARGEVPVEPAHARAAPPADAYRTPAEVTETKRLDFAELSQRYDELRDEAARLANHGDLHFLHKPEKDIGMDNGNNMDAALKWGIGM